jgi:hypothetical protein
MFSTFSAKSLDLIRCSSRSRRQDGMLTRTQLGRRVTGVSRASKTLVFRPHPSTSDIFAVPTRSSS